MATSKLTDQQEIFLDALFGEAKGDFPAALKIAGYPKNARLEAVLSNGLKEVIVERAKTELAMNAPKAVLQLGGMLGPGPSAPDAKIKLAVIVQVLDRANIVKTDNIVIDTKGGLFILPSKDELPVS